MKRFVSPFAGVVVSSLLAIFPLTVDGNDRIGFWSIGALSESDFYSSANSISGDGSTVVGQSRINGKTEAVIWTEQSGIQSLGVFNGMSITRATGVSHDGSVVVGAGYTQSAFSNIFRWTMETGLTDLTGCGCDNTKAGAEVSADGLSIISTRNNLGFIWTAKTGPVDIVDFPGGHTANNPIDISPDGSIVVGNGSTEDGPRGFRWTKEGGLLELGELMYSAYAVSADGKAIAGLGFQDSQGVVRWTEEEGTIWLGHLPGLSGRPTSWSTDISADGSIIVGSSGGHAFRWTEDSGMQSVQGILKDLGFDLTGWQLTSVNAISADGGKLVGYGINPAGNSEGWVAAIPPRYIPEPASLSCWVIFCTLCGTLSRLRRTR